ncbi:MAG TPA: NAD(P)/FAD-dependent oxidoreductase [Gemmataceae bacterium]|nr:NAD(P)/FAD-dependent oxidoreductase [Gemmataceae bacterium]
MEPVHQVVIVGGGFAGLKVAQSLKRVPVHVTLLDRRNFYLFQPLLYQVATGALSPANIAAPLRSVLKRHRNVQVLLAEVLDFDVVNRRVVCREGTFPYDTLVVAAGVRHQYFGHDDWEPFAPSLKTIEDATAIRRRILTAFEEAELEGDAEKRKPWMTFVVVGGGPTGVEMASAIGDLARNTLKRDFRKIATPQTRVVLLEGTEHILPTFPVSLSAKAEQALARLGVTVRTRAMVTDVRADAVTFRDPDGTTETIAAKTILWAAGVQASPLGQALARAAGAELDRAGRVVVQPDLSLKGHPEIFVLGDLAHMEPSAGQLLPGVAQVAIQEGVYVARLIRARLRGQTLPPFEYKDRGNMATVGHNAAVADLGWLRLWGFLGWLLWLFIHLLYIEQYDNRFLILIQWAWSYFTRNRSARLITGETKGLRRANT